MATDNKLPHEKPLASWFHHLHALSRAAEDTHVQAEKMRQKGRAIRIEADGLAKFTQLDNNNRLNDRINCVRQWRVILTEMLNQLKATMRRLADTKTQTDHFLANLADAMMVNVESITHRDIRKDLEYVDDPVQEELRKEAQLGLEVRSTLQALIDDAIKHLAVMINTRHEIERDLIDKEKAINIDIEQYNRNEKSGQIGFKPFWNHEAQNHLDLQTWDDLGRATIERCRLDILKGIAIFEELYDELHKAANRLKYQAEMVSEKLRRRIFELKTAIKELQYQQKPLEEERTRMLHDIRSWQSAREAKIASLKLAQSRMEARLDRPGNENELDAPYYGLREECGTLTDSIDALDEQITKGRENLQQIEERLSVLCEDIRTKTHALSVDENVVGIRRRLELPPALSYPPCPLVPNGLIREKINFY